MHTVQAKTILSAQNGMNLYRGCTHGCIYCDSRSKCYRMEHAFEDVAVKQNAPELLDAALRRRSRYCMIGTGSMSDPYLPLEKEFQLTRRCLEIIDRRGFGVTLLTKSPDILRDIDLLYSIHAKARCVVQMTLTTADDTLCRIVEPKVAPTSARAAALRTFRDAGIPTVVWLCPLLPLINDTEENVRGILEICFEAGVKGIVNFGMGMTLRAGNREYFYDRLDADFPGLRAEYEKRYGLAYQISSPRWRALDKLFREQCAAHGVMCDAKQIFAWLREFRSPLETNQTSLF